LITGWLVATHPEHALNRSVYTRAPGPGEVVACPFGVHFCPAGEGSLVPGLRGCDLLENPQRTNQHADGPGRRISPCSEPGGRIWCIAESGGRSAGPSCLVLTLICPIAEFSFAFAQGPSFASPPIRRARRCQPRAELSSIWGDDKRKPYHGTLLAITNYTCRLIA
jgi:hypothetical protein